MWHRYNKEVPLAGVKRGWAALADALCGQWNVFAADLQNEPWRSSWGDGNVTGDWRLGAEDIGNHVQSLCPRWLIMVQGVGIIPGSYTLVKGQPKAVGAAGPHLVPPHTAHLPQYD